jgi:putative intracellular protease/amidase
VAGLIKAAIFAFALTAALYSAQADAQAKRYVCVPCGLPCDIKFFDKPGTCPDCGMALVTEEEAKAALAATPPPKRVAVLIFDGAEIIDFTGPYEIFGAAGFDVYTVSNTKKPITTAMGMTVVPQYSFADVPLPDVLVVPGGGVKATQANATILQWIREETAKIKHTMSVCNGSFILASAGLLDGLSATTTYGNISKLRAQFPKINVVDDQRYVDNGKIITTAGLSAGIDGALHVVELLEGKGAAEQTALLEEYDWEANSTFVRASLADHLIPDLSATADYGRWEVASTEGGTDRWDLVVRGSSPKTPGELMALCEQKLGTAGKWTKVDGWTDGTSKWTFRTKDGAIWNGTVTLTEAEAPKGGYTVKVSIAKAG